MNKRYKVRKEEGGGESIRGRLSGWRGVLGLVELGMEGGSCVADYAEGSRLREVLCQI